MQSMLTQLGLETRPITETDLETVRSLHNDDEVLKQLTDPRQVNELAQQDWFRALCSSQTSRRFVVEKTVTVGVDDMVIKRLVGVFRIDATDRINRSIMVGLDIAKPFRGKMLSIPIYVHFLDVLFRDEGFHRIHLKVLATNARASSIYSRLGFIKEGVERQAIWRDNRWVDYELMSILADEWDAHRPALLASLDGPIT